MNFGFYWMWLYTFHLLGKHVKRRAKYVESNWDRVEHSIVVIHQVLAVDAA